MIPRKPVTNTTNPPPSSQPPTVQPPDQPSVQDYAPASPPQADPSSTTQNPVAAVGRKVKSAFTSSQQPSVRIKRESERPHPGALPSNRLNEKPLPPLPAEDVEPNESTFAGRFSNLKNSVSGVFRSGQDDGHDRSEGHEYDSDMVDLLDVVDPEVSTLSTLTNVQNSLFIPQLGKMVNRRPTYTLSSEPSETRTIDKLKNSLKSMASLKTGKVQDQSSFIAPEDFDFEYAVLPDNVTLRGWKKEDLEEMDDLVRHMLHSRRAKFRRSMRGFWQYVRRPLGLFITVYATLITLFGAAWVLFLIGWISLGSKRSYIINVVDNVLVALFAIIGDGLAPFRAVDTYHMIYIAYYHRKTWKTREEIGLPKLVDHNDLPEQRKEDLEPSDVDLESLVARKVPRGLAKVIAHGTPKNIARRFTARRGHQEEEGSHDYTVLTEEEQSKLEFHERKFSKSHTFYKPHETETHYAFPLKLLVAVVVLLDLHSCLQISLGACTWGIPYQTRPFALTTVILCCSITCNIMGGVLISIGDKRTRKKDVIERMMKQELTSEAMEEIETRRLKEAEERGEVDKSVRKRKEEEKEEAENEEIKKSWKHVPALPKTLLGKGEDHRQPSLPQKDRRSRADVDSTSSPASEKSKSRSNTVLPTVQEAGPGQAKVPARPKQVVKKGDNPSDENVGQRFMRFVRRADLDKS